jgi:peptidyl-prolyl cis-trans isomerase C
MEMSAKIRASHILVEKQSQALKIVEELKAGGNFSELAKKYSTCPSGKRGGDLGRFGRGQMVKEFEQTAFALKHGQVSEPVKTQFGYHIIKRTG